MQQHPHNKGSSTTSTTLLHSPAPFAVGSASPSTQSFQPSPSPIERTPSALEVDAFREGNIGSNGLDALMSSTRSAKKGKSTEQQVREVESSPNEELDDDRRAIVDKVLERAKVSKMVRSFQTRLALAAFKAERGWQNHRLDEIEPHIDQVERDLAAKRQMEKEAAALAQRQQYQQHLHSSAPSTSSFDHMGPPVASGSGKRQRMDGMAEMAMANTTIYDQPEQYMPVQHSYATNDIYPPYPTSHSHQHHQNHPMTIPYAQPHPHSHPSTPGLAPPVQLQNLPLQQQEQTVPPSESHRSKRRQTIAAESMTEFLPNGAGLGRHSPPPRRPMSAGPAHVSPRHRQSASRSRPNKPNQQPISSSDPNFNSFVDAASVLTGLSRGPSETSVLGTSEEMATSSSLPNGVGSGLPRPRTPTRAEKGKNSEWNENPADAAELMLFLAASPSPAQVRSGSIQMGEGMKGRRLFSNDGDHGHSLGEDPFSSTSTSTSNNLDNRTSSSEGSFSSIPTSNSVHSTSMFDYHPSSLASSFFPTSTSNTSSYIPHSPPRDQQPAKGPMTPSRSANGGTGWDSFLNVSPSPTRSGQAFSMPMSSALPMGAGSSAEW